MSSQGSSAGLGHTAPLGDEESVDLVIRQTDSTSTRSSYPWRASETGLYLASDRDLEPTWSIAPAQALLGLDGVFLHRDGLREYWMFSIFFDTDFHGQCCADGGP